MTQSDRFYRLLLRLYPREFRTRYERAMTDFHRDRIAAARQARESETVLWLRTAADVATSAAHEHARNFFSEERVIETIAHDLAFGVRSLVRRPAFTAIVVATIALGVGANAAIFSVVNGILLRPLPYPHADRLVSFGHEAPTWLTSEPNFVDYRRDMTSIEGLGAYMPRDGTLTIGDPSAFVSFVPATTFSRCSE